MYRRRNYKKKTYRKSGRRTLYRRMKRARFASQVKRIVRTTQETKFLDVGEENKQLYHDVGAGAGPTTNQIATLFDPWQYINVGTGRQNRIGDQVTPRGIKIRLWLSNKLDRVDILYRIVIAVLPRAIGTTYTVYNNVDLFKAVDQGSCNNTMCGMVDMEKVKKVLVDRTYRLSNSSGYGDGTTGKEVHMLKTFWLKAKRARPIKYTAAGAHANNLLGVYVIPYDAYGTLQTDNIASHAYIARLYFKDA